MICRKIITRLMTVVVSIVYFISVSIFNIPTMNVDASGIDNIIARADYMYNTTWTAQTTVTGWKTTFYEGNTYHIPYGQPATAGKYIGFAVSVDTFLESTKDSSSIFYTSQSYWSGTGTRSTYYASDCSAFVSYCWGVSRTTTANWKNLNVTSLGSASNSSNVSKIQHGDALNSTSDGHIVLVTAVNSDGTYEITEQTPPQMKRTTYTASEICSKYSSYTIYRYNNRDNVPAPPNYDPDTKWYETLTPINLGNSFDALILNKAAWIPVRTLSSTNVVTHPEEWVTDELWRFTRQSDGSYQILNWKNGLCLDADNFGTTDGTNIGSVASNNSTAQKWFIYSVNGGYVLRPSYGELAMDSWGDSTSNGNNVHLWSYQGHDGQVMSIYKDEAAPLGKPAPSAPTVTAVSDTSLSVTWSSTIYTDKYIVYRSTDNSTWTKLGEVTTPGYTDTGLKANTKYYYKYESSNRFYTVASASASGTTKPVPTYTVKYNSNKGTGSMSDSTFTRDQSATLRANAFTRTGYTFAGWNTKADGSGTSYSDKASVKNLAAAGGSITLYANWEANSITVAYNANGGTGTMNNQSMKYDQTANLTANAFTRTGYTFVGWNTKADGSGTSYADKASVKNLAASGTVTLYAKWTANKYTVKFDGNGANELSKTSMEVTYNSTYGELPQPTRSGYNFIGWYTQAEGGALIASDTKVTITDIQTLYAQWSQVKFLITFNATGGTSESAQKLVTYDKAYGVLPTAERTGYTFKGWYLDEGCTQQITSDTIVALTANQAVYAKWELRRYVITFDATGGVAERDSKQVTYGKTYGVLPTASKVDDEFIGWFTEDGTEITSASIVEIESDTTLYAKWASDEIVGDVNADGVFNVADVVMMQKWLLCAGELTDWQAGDLCRDERIDVFDLCLMKRMLLGV